MPTQQGATFGAALKQALSAARMNQADLARSLSVDPGQVSRWVNGRAIPHLRTVDRIEEALRADLSEAFEASTPIYELYVAAPITGLDHDRIPAHHDMVASVVATAREHVNSLYWPGEAVRSKFDLTAADLATEKNMNAIAHCSAFLYLQFEDVVRPTGALIELGLALGRRMKTTIISLNTVRLATMLEGFAGVAAGVNFLPKARIYMVPTVDDACELVVHNGRDLLGLA